ncbi:MAG: hypothetical protein CM1200mP34_3430 [Verrucomicrobiales bacterium]|nr:MAG: hypothetical protein CM1200mP34_3430 [Verrucomicrobiales bacterium]
MSTLLTITNTGLPASGAWRHLKVHRHDPLLHADDDRIIHSSSATSTWVRFPGEVVPAPLALEQAYAPVSTSVNACPSHSTSALSRSRVTPGRSCTIATRLRAIQLNRADFPHWAGRDGYHSRHGAVVAGLRDKGEATLFL